MIKEIKFTDKALKQIDNLLSKKDKGSFFRIAIKGGGCSGFQYTFRFDTQKNDDDLVFEKNGIEVVVDKVSLELVHGGTLDYVEELICSYFQVTNPNASSSCGCGTSFSI